MAFDQNIQIKIALSVNKVRVLIKILAESHMAFDLGDKIALPNPTLGRRNGFLQNTRVTSLKMIIAGNSLTFLK